MASQKEGVNAAEVDKEVPSSSTSTTDLDLPNELPKFTRRSNNWNLTRMQRSKSVPDSSHMGNRRVSSNNVRDGPRGLRMFKRSFSVQWRSSRYAKMPSMSSVRGVNDGKPILTTVNQEIDEQSSRETVETPPPLYSSVDSTLDIVPGCPPRLNRAFTFNESDSVMNTDPPPSYRDLFSNRMRHTVRQMSIHSASSEFSQGCSNKTIAKFLAIGIFFIGFAIVLPVAMVIQGLTHLDDCPVEPRIPIFLILGGLLQILECIGRLICKHCVPDNHQSPEDSDRMSWDPLLFILFILLILSSIYIYQTHPSFDNQGEVSKLDGYFTQTTVKPTTGAGESHSNLYCHESTFKLAFWIVTCYLVVLVVSIVGTMLFVLCGAYMTYREQRRMGLHERNVEQT